jgi:C4-dicarboxylate-specific signal transduction histidine kinase
VGIALSSLGVLLLVFTYFLLRADRTIRRGRKQLVKSNEALHELSRNLEHLVETRTLQLIEKEKLASLGGLAAGLAHEINTPLATIAACSEGSAARLRASTPGDAGSAQDILNYLEIINAEAFRCKEITRSLLDYSRQSPISEQGKVDLNELVDQTLVLLRLRKERLPPRLETELEESLPRACGDPAQLLQVIHNLTENALYAVRGADDGRVLLRTRSTADAVIFECEDNGPGVSAEIRESIFDPFFTTKPSREGIGLGLSLCFSIIQRHGGSLELATPRAPAAEGGPPAGPTLFRFSLRRARTAEGEGQR